MQDRPDAAELAIAVREFLEAEILPQLTDHRLKFRALVAVNALGMLSRELEHGEALVSEEYAALRALLEWDDAAELEDQPELDPDESADDAGPSTYTALQAGTRALQKVLAARIRAGNPPEGAVCMVRASIERKLKVASPKYLSRVR